TTTRSCTRSSAGARCRGTGANRDEAASVSILVPRLRLGTPAPRLRRAGQEAPGGAGRPRVPRRSLERERSYNARMTVCKHVTYTGRVQGVGFRWTARHVAERFAVGGYVRNRPDGAVELVAEGPADQVEAFLTALAQRMAGYIQHTDVRDEPPG